MSVVRRISGPQLRRALLSCAIVAGSLVGASQASAQLISAAFDYPPEALREGMEGNVGFEVKLSARGEVKECRVLMPSGFDPSIAPLAHSSCKWVASGRRKMRMGGPSRPPTPVE